MKAKVIGLTGQTGAGKSTVSEFAGEMGYEIINADKEARKVLEKGSECLKILAEVFGCDIIKEDGTCDRKILAQKAFASRENTDLLNKITHPRIIERIGEYILAVSEKTEIILFDAPQLFESGGDKLCDKVIAITAPREIRLKRIKERDGISESEALLRINAQYGEEYYTSRADFIIDGSKSIDEVKQEFQNIVRTVLNR